MRPSIQVFLVLILFGLWPAPGLIAKVTNSDELVDAINNGSSNDTVDIGPGTFELTSPLKPKKGMAIRGAGADQTIIKATPSWQPGTDDLPGSDTDHTSINRNAYLIDLGNRATDVAISNLTLTAPALHGGVYGNNCDALELANCRIEDFQWSGLRTFRMDNARIHDNTFVDAGGKHNWNGGAVFVTYVKDSEFWNNHIYKTPDHHSNFYGFKGRKATRCRFHHNTVEVNFSLELPFRNDKQVEIDHNVFVGVISVPKHSGGAVPDQGHSFHIHHNWLQNSYALEWPRNGASIHHNLFDFNTENDGGNLITDFSSANAPGPTDFHDNLVKNPGRGLFWGRGVYNNLSFHHNHVIGHRTTTPRTEGLFGFNKKTDFSTIEIKNNIIELHELDRPLMRNEASYDAVIKNNELRNVSDTSAYANPATGAHRGPRTNLSFQAGAHGEYTIDGWNAYRTNSASDDEGN